jgi:hypothetical protein
VARWEAVKKALTTNARALTALNGRCETGGILDISFLEGTTGSQPVTKEVAGYAQVSFGKKLKGNANLAQATIVLPEKMDVLIAANISARRPGLAGGLCIGFHNTSEETGTWIDSTRMVGLAAEADRWVNLGSIYRVAGLGAGTHTIYWKIATSENSEVEFSAGAMTLQALPAASDASSPSSQPTGDVPIKAADGKSVEVARDKEGRQVIRVKWLKEAAAAPQQQPAAAPAQPAAPKKEPAAAPKKP